MLSICYHKPTVTLPNTSWQLVCKVTTSRHKGAIVCRPEVRTCTIPGPCCCLWLSWLSSRSQGSPDWLLAEQASPPLASFSCWRPWQPFWVCCWRWLGRPLTRRRCLPAAFRSSWSLHLSYWRSRSMLLVCLEVFCFWGMGHSPGTKVTHHELCTVTDTCHVFGVFPNNIVKENRNTIMKMNRMLDSFA